MPRSTADILAEIEAASGKEAASIIDRLLADIARQRLSALGVVEVGISAADLTARIEAAGARLARVLAGAGYATDLVERTAMIRRFGQAQASAGGVTVLTADFVSSPVRDLVTEAASRTPLPAAEVERLAASYEARISVIETRLAQQLGAHAGDKVLQELSAGNLDAAKIVREARSEAGVIADAETIVQVQNGQNGARLEMSQGLPDIVAMEYRTLFGRGGDDGRVRENHLAGDGYRAAVDSPIWADHTPPLGYSCRCQLVPVRRSEVSASKLDAAGNYVDDPVPPGFEADEGFAPALAVFNL